MSGSELAGRVSCADGAQVQPTILAGPDRAPDALRVGVAFASRGRGDVLSDVVDRLAAQTRKPDAVVLSCVTEADAGRAGTRPDVTVHLGPPGLARQRNAALTYFRDGFDVVVFFDDDFVAHPKWIESVETLFKAHPDIVAITGTVLADGIKGPGLTVEAARGILESWNGDGGSGLVESYSPYGCNMAFRHEAIAGLAFDERLVLYGWLEDRDFGGALARRGGRLVKAAAAAGVHLGVKAGRTSGRRLGYSQVANPIYLRRKGTMTTASLADHIFRNMASNVSRAVRPEPYIDRRGRLEGNLLALKDLILGRLAPEQAETL